MKQIKISGSFSVLIFLVLFLIQPGTSAQEPYNCSVKYIGNEGFLINSGSHKILIDALFGGIKGDWCEQPSDSILNLMVEGYPPFGGIDAVLISHYHSDHFNESIVSRFMLKNTNSILVCPAQVSSLLSANKEFIRYSDRVVIIPSALNDTTIHWGDMEVKAMKLRHGSYFEKDTATGESIDLHKNVENIAYLLKTGKTTFVHSGDASVKSFEKYSAEGIYPETVDFAFMDRIFMQPEGMKVIGDIIKPVNLIFMHIEPSRVGYYKQIIQGFPGIYIFSEPMEVMKF